MNLLHDLRRRRIFRLVGLYIVGAWVVIQVAEALFQAWGIPDTAMRFVFIGAFLCFPIALVFGWIYDITGKGIVRTRSADPNELVDVSLRRADYLILGALLVVGAAVLLGSADKVIDEIEHPTASTVVERIENSIAVLPFTNLDMQADTGFFSDGITEEILHRLSTLGALHVLASNSSFAFRDSATTPADISAKLGVRYLLLGSVRREQENVRVTARLLDQTGLMVWSDSYDRELKGIFSIQAEIASTVSGQVLNKIVPFTDLPAGRTTQNIQAYDRYLVGRAFFNARTPGWQQSAEAAFRQALEYDDGFAPAYAGLAMSLYVTRKDPTLIPEAHQAARRSLELDPDLAEGHAILGLIVSEQEDDPDLTLQLLTRAIDLDPSLAVAYNWLAIAYSDQGLTTEGEATQSRGLEIDPLNPPLAVNVANRHANGGDFDRAEQLMLRLTDLPEPPGMALFELMALYYEWGRLEQSNYWAGEVARRYAGTPNAIGFASLAWTFERLGLSEDADYWMNVYLEQTPGGPGRFQFPSYLARLRGDQQQLIRLLEIFEQSPEFGMIQQPNFASMVYGFGHIFLGDFQSGIDQLESTFDISFQAMSNGLGYEQAIGFLQLMAHAYRQVGQTERATELLLEVAEVVESDDQGLARIPMRLESIATNRALLGDYSGSLLALREAVNLGWTNYFWLINDPVWADTLEQPGFQELLDEVRIEVERQRENVEAADRRLDLRAEVQLILSR